MPSLGTLLAGGCCAPDGTSRSVRGATRDLGGAMRRGRGARRSTGEDGSSLRDAGKASGGETARSSWFPSPPDGAGGPAGAGPAEVSSTTGTTIGGFGQGGTRWMRVAPNSTAPCKTRASRAAVAVRRGSREGRRKLEAAGCASAPITGKPTSARPRILPRARRWLPVARMVRDGA